MCFPNFLQIIIFDLQRAAGPYRWATSDFLRCKKQASLFAHPQLRTFVVGFRHCAIAAWAIIAATAGGSPPLSDIDPLIIEARAHLEAATALPANLPDYGSRWEPQVRAMRRDLPLLRDRAAALRYAQYHITFDGRPPFPADPMIIQFREWAVENEFPHLISVLREMRENPSSGPASLGTFNGRTVSLILYLHARHVLAGLSYASAPRHIIEIGGGYGEIARLWLTNVMAPAESCVIIDIPEALFFAEVALRDEFGDQVGYFEGRDTGTRILLVPLTRIADFDRPADMVVNTGSMQEMTEEWIDFYMAWLDGFDVRWFYSLNYAAQPIGVMGESRNLWTQRPSAQWSTRHLRLNIPIMDMEGPTRDFLEAVYEKQPATRSLREWSVFRGHILSKTTLVEGLDLLRQDFTVESAKSFADIVIEKMPYRPKELLYVLNWLVDHGQTGYRKIRDQLASESGGEVVPDPGPPIVELAGPGVEGCNSGTA